MTSNKKHVLRLGGWSLLGRWKNVSFANIWKDRYSRALRGCVEDENNKRADERNIPFYKEIRSFGGHSTIHGDFNRKQLTQILCRDTVRKLEPKKALFVL